MNIITDLNINSYMAIGTGKNLQGEGGRGERDLMWQYNELFELGNPYLYM